MTANQMLITQNLLQFCYTCDDAGGCTTEEACRRCWVETGVWNTVEEGAEQTRAMMQDYYT